MRDFKKGDSTESFEKPLATEVSGPGSESGATGPRAREAAAKKRGPASAS